MSDNFRANVLKSRIWVPIDDWYINNVPKNQVSAVFRLRVICRSVSPKFIELSLYGDAMFVPFGRHKHRSRKVTETSVTEFCY